MNSATGAHPFLELTKIKTTQHQLQNQWSTAKPLGSGLLRHNYSALQVAHADHTRAYTHHMYEYILTGASEAGAANPLEEHIRTGAHQRSSTSYTWAQRRRSMHAKAESDIRIRSTSEQKFTWEGAVKTNVGLHQFLCTSTKEQERYIQFRSTLDEGNQSRCKCRSTTEWSTQEQEQHILRRSLS